MPTTKVAVFAFSARENYLVMMRLAQRVQVARSKTTTFQRKFFSRLLFLLQHQKMQVKFANLNLSNYALSYCKRYNSCYLSPKIKIYNLFAARKFAILYRRSRSIFFFSHSLTSLILIYFPRRLLFKSMQKRLDCICKLLLIISSSPRK